MPQPERFDVDSSAKDKACNTVRDLFGSEARDLLRGMECKPQIGEAISWIGDLFLDMGSKELEEKTSNHGIAGKATELLNKANETRKDAQEATVDTLNSGVTILRAVNEAQNPAVIPFRKGLKVIDKGADKAVDTLIDFGKSIF